MPRKKNLENVQLAAEFTTDPLSLFTLAIRNFKKDPSTWFENEVYATIVPLIDAETAELDSSKMLDQAIKMFKSTRSTVAAQLVMEAARLYKSTFLATLAEKYGAQFSFSDTGAEKEAEPCADEVPADDQNIQ